MPKVSTPGEYINPASIGPRLEFIPVPTPVFPPSLAVNGGAGDHWTSDPILADGFFNIIIGVTLSRAGTLTVQRYIDDAAQVKSGALDTVTLVAATPNFLKINDDVPFGSYVITITNTDATGGHTAVISNFAIRSVSN